MTESKVRSNALETDPRFAKFSELYIELGFKAFPAALAAGYSRSYSKAHAHRLAQRLKMIVEPALRSVGVDALHCLYLPVVAEYRQFHKLIILTMMLLFSHDSAIGWEEVLGVTLGGSRARQFTRARRVCPGRVHCRRS